MDTRKETISTLKVCRFCLSESDTLTSLYEKYRAPRNTVTLPLKILSCVSIEVFPSDKMPTYICNRCKFFMDISYDFKHMCRQADEHVLQHVQNGIPLSPLNWPQSLLKLFRLANKSQEVAVMKTVIEGGATVQVTAQESDSDEEDDENVYNVKIGDGSDEGSKSTRVKVITSPEKQDKGKPKRPKDMMTHELTDSNKHYFQCIICPDKNFKYFKSLQNHEKICHKNLQMPCPFCPATYILPADLEAHQENKHFHEYLLLNKIIICELCNDRFPDKDVLRKHMRVVHLRYILHSCQYCAARFSSSSKLSRHVERTHPGERSYPCKYCNKSFIKSHHLTRHLRLKHRENIRTCRGPFGETDQFRCEQCEDSFATQDELIYHSAIHATQNLICPLCQEKFEDVDAVTAHIKSHVTGTEFMCDLCELVFTSSEKLESHIKIAHDEELLAVPDLNQDESSMEMDVDEDEDDTGIHVKEEDDHMVVEIKKANDFMLLNTRREAENKIENTNSEESEVEDTFPDIATVEPAPIERKDTSKVSPVNTSVAVTGGATIIKTSNVQPKITNKVEVQPTASILRKAEEIKKKVIQQPTPEPTAEKKDKNGRTNNVKAENNSVGASDKSLRLLEKELQELKRTNTRSEVVKTPAKPVENLRNRRAQIHTSTSKLRATPVEEKKAQVATKSPAVEKKLPERRVVTKENKEPKESKDTKANNVSVREEKEVKENKENKEKETKEKETPKNVVKNGNNDKSNTEEGGIRRSTRPSKIKDYAKMIRDRSQDSDDVDESENTDDEEYKETEKVAEVKPKPRRASVKTPTPKQTPPVNTPVPRKRGRPRKEPAVASKLRKEEIENDDEESSEVTENEKDSKTKTDVVAEKEEDDKNTSECSEDPASAEQKSSLLVSPSGQTLKKIPIKALPPGVKPMPLPINARPMGGEVCEMQIGRKVVKVQKIVMTKAEVEAMAKKGLVEMKDGTMVLKAGIKIPSSEAGTFKPNLVGEDAGKESPSKKATPSRCDFGEE